jgi:redox-sensing transcriptional repressor
MGFSKKKPGGIDPPVGGTGKDDSTREVETGEGRLSRASVGRLSLYLRRLEGFLGEGTATVSSGQLGEALGVTDAQVRKDLGYLGNLGLPGVGYPIRELIGAIRRTLGIDREWGVAVVGVGNLARALLRYRGFQQQGFRIVALFDADPGKIGQWVEGLQVQPPERMAEVIRATGAELGLVTVPSESAQAVADALVAAGVRGLLNFAPHVLRLPPHVSLVAVDLTVQLEQLAFLVQWGGHEQSPRHPR